MANNDWIREACKQQNDYCNIFAEWKLFDRGHTEYIKSMIGIILFGVREDIDDPPPTVRYYRVYNAKNQEIIETIYKHVMKKCHLGDVYLSCTYLIGKPEDDGEDRERIFSLPVLRYCASPRYPIYFAESSGRYYEGWADLTSSIKLPPCHLIAPSNGLYSFSNPTYENFLSPEATSAAKVKRFANVVASGGAIACTVATMCAFAPVTFATLGFGLSAFGVKQSIAALRDRSRHGQSIALDNRESILSYGNIIANGLSVGSFAAVSNLGRLQRVFGNYANGVTTTCKVLNISTVIFDSSFLLLDALDFFTKLRDGTVTFQDVSSLSLQIFLVCGAVVQARDMHRLLNQTKLSPSAAGNKKLTKTQKRNIQKRRAKARARGDALPVVTSQSSENTLTVGENELFTSMKNFSLRVGSFGVNVMLNMYPRAEIILNYYYDLRDLIKATFISRTMGMKEFLQQIFYQTRNLYTIICQDIARMREILQRFIPDPLVHGNEMIAQTVNNELDRVDQAAEEFMPTSESEAIGNTEEHENQNYTSTAETKERMILQFVQNVCSKYRTEDTASTQISFFHSVLIFTVNYVNQNSIQLFEQVFDRSKTIAGEESAKRMMPVLGTKTENDFYPTNEFLEIILKNSDTALEEFLEYGTGIECVKITCSSLAQEIFAQYAQLLSSTYARVNEPRQPGELGILYLTRTLEELSTILENKLGHECQKIAFNSRSLYEEHIEMLGQKITEEMMKTINMPTTESAICQTAMKSLNIEEIISEVKFKNGNSNESVQPTSSRSEIQSQENSHEEIILSLIKTLYDEIDKRSPPENRSRILSTAGYWYERIMKGTEPIPHFESKHEMFIAITKFVTEKLITDLKLDAKLCEELKPNEELVGRKLLKSMLETIGRSASEKLYLLKTKVQILRSERNLENMIAEFSRQYRSAKIDIQQPKIFDATTGDDGFVTYKITCDQNGSDDSYKELVYLLFKFKVDASDCKIVRDRRSVIVKTRNKVILFNFPNEENIAVVILSDLDKENTSFD